MKNDGSAKMVFAALKKSKMMFVLNPSTQRTWENLVIFSGTKSELIVSKIITI